MPILTPRRTRAVPDAPVATTRLDLTIGRMTYQVEPLADALPPGSRAFRLIKQDGTIYDVAETSYGPECDCADYLFRREGLDPSGCKHVKAMVRLGLIARVEYGRSRSQKYF